MSIIALFGGTIYFVIAVGIGLLILSLFKKEFTGKSTNAYPISTNGQPALPQNPTTATTQAKVQPQLPPKPPVKIDPATWLLYVGGLLVLIALFAFVIFNWYQYSDLTKNIIITIATATSLLTGGALYRYSKLKSAGKAFLVIGAISVALTGIGYWNFGLKLNTDLKFYEYWVPYSVFLTAIYLLLAKRYQIEAFKNVAITSAYSAIISASLSVSDLTMFRVMTFSVLNMAFMAGSYKGTDSGVKTLFSIARVINGFLAVIIPLTVVSTYKTYDGILHQIVAVMGLLSTFVSNFIVIISGESASERAFTSILIPVNLILTFVTFFPFVKNIYYLPVAVGLVVLGTILLLTNKSHHFFLSKQVWMMWFASIVVAFLATLTNNPSSYLQTVPNLHLVLTYATIALCVNFISYAKEKSALKLLALPFEIVSINLLFDILNNLITGGVSEIMQLIAWLTVATLYAVEFDYSRKLSKLHPSIFGIFIAFLFALITSAVAWKVDYLPTVAFGYATLYSLFALLRYKAKSAPFFLYISSLLTLLAVYDLASVENRYLSLGIALLSIGFMIFTHFEGLIKWLELSEEDEMRLQLTSFIAIGLHTLVILPSTSNGNYTYLVGILLGLGIAMADKLPKMMRYMAGIPMIVSVWDLASTYDWGIHGYTSPISIYFIVLSYLVAGTKEKLSKVYEMAALFIPLYVLLSQSISESDTLKVFYGLVLIGSAILVFLYGLYKNQKHFIYMGIGFAIIELLIRLYVVLINIPWWIYVGIAGLGLMLLAVKILSDRDENKADAKSDVKKS